MIFVIGANGRIGQKIVSAFKNREVVSLERGIYENWWRSNAIDEISRYFVRFTGEKPATLFVASGILDPSKTTDEHYKVNYLLPKNLIHGASKVGIRTITFGTVMEQLIENTVNPYITSKIRFGDFICQFSQDWPLLLHIRLHTIYGGGAPSPFMFLGQMFQSLKAKTIFKMSSGEQLREYHHIDDEISAILALQQSNITGTIDISHGQPISLKQLAKHVFCEFQCAELLDIGALPAPDKDNYEISFKRTFSLQDMQFRETLTGVVDYFRDLVT